MFVRNDVRVDARVLREAGALAASGWRVTVVGRATAGGPGGTVRAADGVAAILVREDTGWRRRWREHLAEARRPWRARHRIEEALRPSAGRDARRAGLATSALLAAGLPWVLYRVAAETVAGGGWWSPSPGGWLDRIVLWHGDAVRWAAAAAAAAPPARVAHGHDLAGLLAAGRVAAAQGIPLVYDSHDLAADATAIAGSPAPVRLWVRRIEREAARQAAAVITVNQGLADVLRARLRPRRLVVLHNVPPAPTAAVADARGVGGTSRLAVAAGVPPGAPLVVYHGGLMAQRGIEQLLSAALLPEMDGVHVVLLGYGPLRDDLRAQAASGPLAGRLHVLDAVPPSELPLWLAGADVGVMPIQPTTLNHRLSTPNKLFGCIGAGVPVVASDFPAMREIVLGGPDGPLGAVCDPTSPKAIAAAVGSILGLAPADRAELRRRVLRAARERWNWEAESAALVALYDELAVGALR